MHIVYLASWLNVFREYSILDTERVIGSTNVPLFLFFAVCLAVLVAGAPGPRQAPELVL